jgi:hypothetical protein
MRGTERVIAIERSSGCCDATRRSHQVIAIESVFILVYWLDLAFKAYSKGLRAMLSGTWSRTCAVSTRG